MPEWFEFRNFLFLVLFSIFEGVGGVESQFSCLVSGDSGDLCFNGLNFAISKVVSQERGEFRNFLFLVLFSIFEGVWRWEWNFHFRTWVGWSKFF